MPGEALSKSNEYPGTIRRSFVGSCMSLPEAKKVVDSIKKQFGYTEVSEIRSEDKVKFYHISIKLKVRG